MSEKKTIELIKNYIPSLSTSLEQYFHCDRIDIFLDFLKRENERGGFFSKQDAEIIFERHVLDCMVFVWKLKLEGCVSRETNVVDVGTGPGLPGFLFCCLREPPMRVTLLDSQRRKLSLLEEEVLNGKLSELTGKIHFMYERAEDIKIKFDLVTSRAVVPYPFLAEVVTNLVKKKGLLCPYLGQLRFDETIEAKVLAYSGFHVKKQIELSELSFLGKRHIKILQKDSEPKLGYPRPWKEIVKETKQANG
jgi:16S rRNA (guanine527-N7)-methyltransferase